MPNSFIDQIVLLATGHRPAVQFFHLFSIEDILNTIGKTAVADCVLGLYKNQGKKGTKLLGRGGDVAEVEMELFFDPITCCWQLDSKPTENDGEILEALKMMGKSKESSIAKNIGKDRSNTSKRL